MPHTFQVIFLFLVQDLCPSEAPKFPLPCTLGAALIPILYSVSDYTEEAREHGFFCVAHIEVSLLMFVTLSTDLNLRTQSYISSCLRVRSGETDETWPCR